MQAYFEPEQAFFISMPQPVFEISIAYKKKHVAIKTGILRNFATLKGRHFMRHSGTDLNF